MKKYIILGLFLGAGITADAQQDSTWTMTLERDFAPIVHQTDKIDHTPEIEQPIVNRTPVKYATWEAQPSTKSETGNLPFGQVFVERPQDSIGWVDAYIGYPLRGALDAYARYRDWNVSLGGQAVWNDRKLNHNEWKVADDYKWKSKYVDGHIRLGYDHTLEDTFKEKARIRAHVGVEGMILKGFNWSVTSRNENLLYWTQADSAQSKNKVFTLFAGTRFDYSQWSVSLNYSYTWLKGPSAIEPDKYNLPKYKYAFEDVSHYIDGEVYWYGTDYGKLRFAASVPFGVAFGNWDGFQFKPTIHLSYLPDQREWRRFFVDAGAGWNHTSMRQFIKTHPLLTQGEFRDKEFDIVDAVAGWEDNEQGYLKYKAWVSAKWATNQVGSYTLADLPKSLGARTQVIRDDNLTLKAGVNVRYEYSRYFRANFDAHWSHFSSDWIIDDPRWNIALHLLSSPTEKLDFDLGFTGGWKDDGMLMDASGKAYKIDMGDIRNLSFRADYQLLPSLSLYLFGDNLLNRKHDLWTLVPAQGIGIYAGAKWSF